MMASVGVWAVIFGEAKQSSEAKHKYRINCKNLIFIVDKQVLRTCQGHGREHE
jgi:hypothetical protein